MCRTFGCLPTEERFQKLELEQKEMLFSVCTRIGGDDAIRMEIWKADEEKRKRERAEALRGKGAYLMPTALIAKMVEELMARGMSREKAEETARQRADIFVARALEQREEHG